MKNEFGHNRSTDGAATRKKRQRQIVDDTHPLEDYFAREREMERRGRGRACSRIDSGTKYRPGGRRVCTGGGEGKDIALGGNANSHL